ncbi:MAG: hypothetical protein ACETWQ_19995 [Phycisphaerae bacterium]
MAKGLAYGESGISIESGNPNLIDPNEEADIDGEPRLFEAKKKTIIESMLVQMNIFGAQLNRAKTGL